jgi:glycosyltransferase involved in cell wall biosynthesis
MASLSVVMPAYNEAEHIEECVREWYAGVIAGVPGSEMVVIDDCSRDGTDARLQLLTSRLPQLRVLRTPANMGHGPAVRMGLDSSSGEFVFQTDSDRQHSPDDFWTLWEMREDADFVFGVRSRRADGLFRWFISGSLRLVNLIVWGHWLPDANCPFKLMRRVPLERVLSQIPRDSFIPMVMVAILSRRGGFRVREVPVRHFTRTAGEQSLKGLVKWTKVAWRCVRELVALRARSRRRAAAFESADARAPRPR